MGQPRKATKPGIFDQLRMFEHHLGLAVARLRQRMADRPETWREPDRVDREGERLAPDAHGGYPEPLIVDAEGWYVAGDPMSICQSYAYAWDDWKRRHGADIATLRGNERGRVDKVEALAAWAQNPKPDPAPMAPDDRRDPAALTAQYARLVQISTGDEQARYRELAAQWHARMKGKPDDRVADAG